MLADEAESVRAAEAASLPASDAVRHRWTVGRQDGLQGSRPLASASVSARAPTPRGTDLCPWRKLPVRGRRRGRVQFGAGRRDRRWNTVSLKYSPLHRDDSSISSLSAFDFRGEISKVAIMHRGGCLGVVIEPERMRCRPQFVTRIEDVRVRSVHKSSRACGALSLASLSRLYRSTLCVRLVLSRADSVVRCSLDVACLRRCAPVRPAYEYLQTLIPALLLR
jgi:hypothetical protein